VKNNRKKWWFSQSPTRPVLEPPEVLYWKRNLDSILKVGMEFELNLPEKKDGVCEGDNITCLCTNYDDDGTCWKKCINDAGCKPERNTINCTNITGTCEDTDCPTCEHFAADEFECHGINCPNFVSFCAICRDYTPPCETCKFKFDPEKDPENIRSKLKKKLSPNNTYGRVSESGVHSVTRDGSLLGDGGTEIITCGRRVNYHEFLNMSKKIISEATNSGAYLNERCSIHMHVLASYYGKLIDDQENSSIPRYVSELERNLPEIVVANLHQLVRRYQNAMTWMTMGLSDKKHMTRWEKFRVSVLDVSAKTNHMSTVHEIIAGKATKSKYGWINYKNTAFSRDGNVSRLHVEFRGADGLLSPSAVAAIACMYYALVIKAVEISRYGVLEVGDVAWLKQAEQIKKAMMNNSGDWSSERFSNTESLYKYFNVLIEESLDLVQQLKAILTKIGPAYEVLEKLAQKPAALRRIDGESWEDIEKALEVPMTKEGKLDVAISEIINLNQISECNNLEEWISGACKLIEEEKDLDMGEAAEKLVRDYYNEHNENGQIVWSNRIGAPIMI
jgi:hypothetical protein